MITTTVLTCLIIILSAFMPIMALIGIILIANINSKLNRIGNILEYISRRIDDE